MWRVYLLEFIVVLLLSITWVHFIDKMKNDPFTKEEEDEFLK